MTVVVVPLPGALVAAASVVLGSIVVVVVLSTAVVKVSVTTTVSDGRGAPPVAPSVAPGNGGRVKVVVTPSEMVTTTD